MKIFNFILFVLIIFSFSKSFSRCGDNNCDYNENTSSCEIDCKKFIKLSKEYFVSKGPEIRGYKYNDGMITAAITNKDKLSILEFTIFDSKLNKIFTKSILSRFMTDTGTLGNPQLLVAPDKTIYLTFRDHSLIDKNNPIFNLRVIRSTDGGNNWDFINYNNLKDGYIDSSTTGLWEPFLYFDIHSNLRVVYAKVRDEQICFKQRNKKQDIVSKISYDFGKSWSDEQIVSSDGISREGVPSVTQITDKSFYMTFESWQSSTCENHNSNLLIKGIYSKNGINWDRRDIIFNPYNYSQGNFSATWPFISSISDKRSVVVFTSNFFENYQLNKNKKEDLQNRNYNIYIMASNGEPRFGHIQWDYNSLTTIFNHVEPSFTKNRFPSLTILKDNRIVVFSGAPNRFIIVNL